MNNILQLLSSTVPVVKDLELFSNFSDVLLKIIAPLAAAFLISGYIGLERQNVGKSAGVSSHVLVALAATGIAIFNRQFFDWQIDLTLASGESIRPEGQRVISQVISGVGFIGAGVIFKGDKNNMIKGITTAATIWAVALTGVILGSGYLLTGLTLGAVIVVFITVRDLHRRINPLVPIDIQRAREGNKIKDEEHYD